MLYHQMWDNMTIFYPIVISYTFSALQMNGWKQKLIARSLINLDSLNNSKGIFITNLNNVYVKQFRFATKKVAFLSEW